MDRLFFLSVHKKRTVCFLEGTAQKKRTVCF